LNSIAVVAAVLVLVSPGALRAEEFDFRTLDLAGAWYVRIDYRDARSEDESVHKFKDWGWQIESTDKGLSVDEFPYVLFDDTVEAVRKQAMREHTGWAPEGRVLERLREGMRVSSRAATRKRLRGSVEEGFRTPSAAGGGGAMTLTFTRDWQLTFREGGLRIEIVDSLSGDSDLLGDTEEKIVFDIDQRVSEDELRGKYKEGPKAGTVTLVRSDRLEMVN